jgi:hypothetical protein
MRNTMTKLLEPTIKAHGAMEHSDQVKSITCATSVLRPE